MRDCVADPRWRVGCCDLEQRLGLERELLREGSISLAHVGRLLHPLPEEHALKREGAGCKQPNIACLPPPREPKLMTVPVPSAKRSVTSPSRAPPTLSIAT